MIFTLQFRGALVTLLFLSLQPFALTGQATETYSWFDETVGSTGTGIFNGIGYVEAHRTVNEHHKFFLSIDFLPGTIIYDGQPYFSQLLKYNIFDEVLLIQARDGEDISLFQLIDDKIDGFEIQGHVFTNIKEGMDPKIDGFYEVLLENEEFQVLKKHSLNLYQIIEQRSVYYEFKPVQKDYVLRLNSTYYNIGSRRDVIEIFPELKKQVREFYSSEKTLSKSNPDSFMIRLFRKISPMIKVNNTTGV